MIETLVKALTPSTCLRCETGSLLLCFACQEETIERSFAVCYACKARSDDYKTCQKCQRQHSRPTYLWNYCRYQGIAKQLIYQMKFDSRRDVARFVGLKLTEVVPCAEFDVVTFVPSAPKRIRRRGYDHCKLIAQEFAQIRELPLVGLLRRIGDSRQVGARAEVRRQQAAIAYLGDRAKNYKNILLIDDVISTGATIETCTKQLKNRDNDVSVACFAMN